MPAARGATPSAFERRCIPSGGVAPPSNTPGMLGRRALPAGRIAALGATMDLHHGLPGAAAVAPRRAPRRVVVHAVSAGETAAAGAFIAAVRRARPDWSIVLTCGNR